MNDQGNEWHREVISDATEAALGCLRETNVLDRFYLAGGTGVALRFGHYHAAKCAPYACG